MGNLYIKKGFITTISDHMWHNFIAGYIGEIGSYLGNFLTNRKNPIYPDMAALHEVKAPTLYADYKLTETA
jgi:hypothetical protein